MNIQTIDDPVDHEDWKFLLQGILNQAVDDYIKLQHPGARQKTYLQEAFLDAVDMFFDKSYRFEALQNDFKEDMNIVDFFESLLQSERINIPAFQKHLIKETNKYWDTKEMQVINIPSTLSICGQVYTIEHTDDEGYEVDYDNRIIRLNKQTTEMNQRNLFRSMAEIIADSNELIFSKKTRESLVDDIFSCIKMNAGFMYQS